MHLRLSVNVHRVVRDAEFFVAHLDDVVEGFGIVDAHVIEDLLNNVLDDHERIFYPLVPRLPALYGGHLL